MCVCVCKRGEVLGVDCKVREANFRCGLEAGNEETVLGGDGGTRFQYYQTNKTKKNNTLIIPLSDWTKIYIASILADSAFSSICALKSSCPLIPGSNIPVCVSGPCTLVISLSLSLMYPNIPGILLLTFVVCRILAALSIVTGVAVSFNVVKPDSGIE